MKRLAMRFKFEHVIMNFMDLSSLLLVIGIILTVLPTVGFLILGAIMMHGTMHDDDNGDKVFLLFVASVAIGLVAAVFYVISVFKGVPALWLLLMAALLSGLPLVIFVGIGCWMLYGELRNEDEWRGIFTGLSVLTFFGVLLLLLYFLLR